MSFYDDASLIMIPSGVKAGTVYSQKPMDSDGQFTFTRASEATRLVDGVVTKVRTNLFLDSGNFGTANWIGSTSQTGGQTGYDGTSNAWLVENNAASNYMRQNNTSTGVLTVSVYAKAGNVNWVRFAASNTPTVSIYFDLVNSVSSAPSNVIDQTIVSVGNGWNRISVTFLASSMSGMQLYPADGSNDLGEAGDNILVQSAQLEQGLVSTPYIATTTVAVSEGPVANMPRLNSVAGGCPSLLLEPQRTNLVTQSEYFGASTWTERSLSVTDNYATSPDGSVNASRILASGSDAALYQSISVTNGTTYTMSVWLKVVSGTLDTTISYSSTGFPDGEGDGGKYKDITVTDTWQRFSLTSTADQTISTITAPIGGFSGFNSGDDVLMWGAQCEAGNFSTSYIPSYGTAATRIADAAYKTGISSLIGSTEGTMFVDILYTVDADNNPAYIQIWQAQTQRLGLFYSSSTNLIRPYLVSTGLTDFGTGFSPVVGQRYKMAFAYKANDYAFYVNGASITIANKTGVPTAGTAIQVGCLEPAAQPERQYSNINQTLLFKTRLTNAELATLTTL